MKKKENLLNVIYLLIFHFKKFSFQFFSKQKERKLLLFCCYRKFVYSKINRMRETS